MIAILDRGLDPQARMNLSYTLFWVNQAWRTSILDQTIKNCFIKSTLIRPKSTKTESQLVEVESEVEVKVQEPGLNSEVQALYTEAIERLGHNDFIPFDQFLDPIPWG